MLKHSRCLRTVVGGVFAGALLLAVPLTAAAGTTSVTFNSTGGEQAFTVPPGITSIHVVAQGGSGGEPDAAFSLPAAGAGGQVTADLSVTPGETLFIEVGANGGDSSSSGSFNGGGGGGCSLSEPFFHCAGAGGGATDVRTITRTASGTLASRLLVAGGGGGGGNFTRSAHDGGSAGVPAGQNGVTDSCGGSSFCTAGGGGGGGDQNNPGGGGSSPPLVVFSCTGSTGSPGVLDTGGTGGSGLTGNSTGGGGGGGGLYGGGGGGVGCNLSGGGGGGGSDLVPVGGTATTSYASPSVTISWSTDSDLALTNTPGNITAAGTTSAGAVVTYTPPTVIDEDSTLPTVSCDTPSGSTFLIGTTTVTCTASDSDDVNSPVSTSFTVTVTDSDLALTGTPANVTANATSSAGAVVNYTPPTAADEDSTPPTVTCDTPSGSTFPIGTTTVTCTASDSDDVNGPVSTAFTVTIVGAAGQLQQLAAAVAGVGPGNSLPAKIRQAEAFYAAGDTANLKGILNAFVNEVQAQSGKKIPQAQAAQLIAAARQIIAVIG